MLATRSVPGSARRLRAARACLRLLPLLALVGFVLTVSAPPPAAFAARIERYVSLQGAPAPGSVRYDRVFVYQVGDRRARTVLVLVPGFLGGAGTIAPVARDLAALLPQTQVWVVDRREQALEDQRGFARRSADAAFDYYFGGRYRRVRGLDVPYVSEWGLGVQLADLRRVVLAARAGGRRVVLGGHSLGASTALAYAAWDFDGHPGYRDIAGLVLIDGGLLGTFDSADAQRARRELDEIRRGQPFEDVLGLGVPELAGIFVETAGLYAVQAPNAPAKLQPLVPPAFRPPFTVTNEALVGYAFDRDTSPPGFEFIRVRAGSLAASGDPRRWVSGERTPIQRLARAMAALKPDFIEWYFPRRLRLDVDAANDLRMTEAAKVLRLRLRWARAVNVPLYAYQTDLTGGRVLRGARRFVKLSRVKHAVLVDDPQASHLDPVVGDPRSNRFLKTVVPFLRRFVIGQPERTNR